MMIENYVGENNASLPTQHTCLSLTIASREAVGVCAQ